MSIVAIPAQVAVDATSLVSVKGEPNRAVYWSLTGSAGTLTPISIYTDDQGRAAAIFSPAPDEEGQTATVYATYGA